MANVEIRRATLHSPDSIRLITALNAELTIATPEPGATHFSLDESQVTGREGAFLIACIDDVPTGCGAVRRIDDATGELKRMYVEPSARGQGIGRALVEALEHEARLIGIMRMVLETGTRLASAVRLYESLGYVRIPLFGEYLASPDTSICFGKTL